MTEETDKKFDDIRPFRDYEVKAVMNRLIKNDDFEKAMKFMMGRELSFSKDGNRIDVVNNLKTLLGNTNSIKEFQLEVVLKFMLQPMIDRTVDSITFSGLEHLSKEDSYLFISNHRDITLDPALLNYNLVKNGFETVEVAFGSNLLMSDFISDFIRANKSFIVKRDLPIMEQLSASKQLSEYISHTIKKNQSVWIAQREGRAKDGNDFTNPAIITMISLNRQESSEPFREFIKNLHIVPVAISYEYDPCDRLKALELYKTKVNGRYDKSPREDLISMNKGISGYKGRIHLSFGEPILKDLENDKAVAKEIDRSIQSSYRLWPTNYIAYDLLNETGEFSSMYSEPEKEKFIVNSSKLAENVKKIIYDIYANPVKNYIATQNSNNQMRS